MMRLFFSLLAMATVCPAATWAIRDVTVIDVAAGKPIPHLTVVVRDDRIVTVGPAATTRVPAAARVVDGRAKFLIPGLWDMHVHLWYPQNQLPAYVAQGITGVRDMGSDFARVVGWRKAILEGKAVGPHIVSSGPAVMGKPSDNPKLPAIVASTPEEARKAVDQLEDMGVDFVKVLSDVPKDAYIALAERVRQAEMDFTGHVPDEVSVMEAVEARQLSIEHMFGMTRAMADDPGHPLETFNEAKLLEFCEESVRFETWQTPSLTLWKRMIGINTTDPRYRLVPQSIRGTWEKPEALNDNNAKLLGAQLALVRRMVLIMQRAKVGILAGTDTGDDYTIPGATLHDELEELVACGLTPAEALRSATLAPARFLRWDESLGQIREGLVADLVLLDADPLTAIGNVRRIAGVAVRGRWIGRQQLGLLK